jgi:hypothetical protein
MREYSFIEPKTKKIATENWYETYFHDFLQKQNKTIFSHLNTRPNWLKMSHLKVKISWWKLGRNALSESIISAMQWM